MPRLRFLFLVLCFVTRFALGDLQTEVQNIVASADLHKGYATVCVIDASTGKVLVDINASRGMIPASNQKLLTTGSFLHVLGPDFTFETKLIHEGNNLIIVGDGDPTIGDTELQGISNWANERGMLEDELRPWIDQVVAAGITEIDNIIVDDRIFDQNFIHPSWPANQLNNWYCAQVAGLNYHLNVVHFFPSPRKNTHADLGEITPEMNWITIGNKTSSKTGKKDQSSFWVARLPNTNTMTARGNVKSKHTAPVKIAFHDPPIVFGQTLASMLRKHGITVNNVVRIEKNAVVKGTVLYTHKTPLQNALKRSNTDSHNMYAEVLLKRLAAGATNREGTFDEGASMIKNVVTQRLGGTQQGLSPADGSGMSRKNQVSTKTLALWLTSFDLNDAVGQVLLHSLATPGIGTLKNRFKSTKLDGATVHAKSGYLSGVCSLSGYIVPATETNEKIRPLVFSIIVNGVKGTVKGAKKMQEAIVFAAFDWLNNR